MYLISSILNAIATVFWMTMLKYFTISSDIKSISIIALAVFIGSIISDSLIKTINKILKLNTDDTWIFNIIPPSNESSEIMKDLLKANNIYIIEQNNLIEGNKISCIKAFSKNKDQSKLIKSLIPRGEGFNIIREHQIQLIENI